MAQNNASAPAVGMCLRHLGCTGRPDDPWHTEEGPMADHQHAYPIRPDYPDPVSESGWFYVSFVDPDRPEGDRFVHGLYIDGEDIGAALEHARELGLNPGGEASYIAVPTEHMPPEDERRRALSRAELIAAGGGPMP